MFPLVGFSSLLVAFLVDDLHRITAPTLILVGENDVHYLSDAELMADTIPDARREILRGVGHAMSVEAPELFADQVLRFLTAPQTASA